MKTLFLDCGMGAAGDMLCAALYELLDENARTEFLTRFNALGIPNVLLTAEDAQKCGITGTHMRVMIGGVEEDADGHHHDHDRHHHHDHDHDHHHDHDHDHHHDHEHDHGHHHSHTGMNEIRALLDALPVSESVRKDASAVYKCIADAESRVHGVPVDQIHFHEVGTMDAVADVVACCMLMELLRPENVIATPIHVGSGTVHCAHGILPVPAPATAHILEGIPIYSGDVQGELCTPTGAALLKHFVKHYSEMPAMRVSRIGYGMGKKDFHRANCVRAMLGETEQREDAVLQYECNLDDMTPERIGFAMEMLFREGALDVWTMPIGMKKSRPGVILCVLCRESEREKIINLIFRHTTTIGIREREVNRYTLRRTTDTVHTPYGDVRVKRSEGYGVTREKYEYEDLAYIAGTHSIGIDEVIRMIEQKR